MFERVAASWRDLRRAGGSGPLRRRFYRDGVREQLDVALADALAQLAAHGPMPMTSLGRALHVTSASTTRLVEALVQRGYATRTRGDDDRRWVTVALTPAGLSRYQVVRDNVSGGLEEILESFSPAERVVLADLLDHFAASIERFIVRLGS